MHQVTFEGYVEGTEAWTALNAPAVERHTSSFASASGAQEEDRHRRKAIMTNAINKILTVDDSELIRRMYQLVFMRYRNKGCQVLQAMNGHEALSVLEEHPDVSLILLDINMPVMDGLQFLEHREREKVFQDIPVIIVSTEGREDDTIRGLKSGALAYVKKPFQPSELHEVIEKIMISKSAKAGGI